MTAMKNKQRQLPPATCPSSGRWPPSQVGRAFFSAILATTLVLAGTNAAAQSAPAGPRAYEPVRGQSGKDVVWIATPQSLVEKMLTAARVTPQDKVFDLGAGDGIVAITAARQFGATATGIEFNPQLAEHARRKVAEAGVGDKVRIITGDIFKEDFSSATVVMLYLLPELNQRLRPTLLDMKPGTRIVSHDFDMGDWQADEAIHHERGRAHLWIVPARVAGDWMLTGLTGGAARVSLRQVFQSVGGQLTLGSSTQPLVGARVRGEEVSFQFIGADDGVQTFSGRLSGNRVTGTLSAHGVTTPAELSRP